MALREVKNLIKHSMFKDNTSLSICIPTYNRPKAFKRLLSRLLPQIDGRVEIVIRDDSPNDDTKKIFYSLIEDINISHKYFHDSKIGLDAAVLFLLENASGDYYKVSRIDLCFTWYPRVSKLCLKCKINKDEKRWSTNAMLAFLR